MCKSHIAVHVSREKPLARGAILAASGQPFHGHYYMLIALHRQHNARAHGLPIHQHSTRATSTMLTANMRSCQFQFMAQEIAEQHARAERYASPVAR